MLGRFVKQLSGLVEFERIVTYFESATRSLYLHPSVLPFLEPGGASGAPTMCSFVWTVTTHRFYNVFTCVCSHNQDNRSFLYELQALVTNTASADTVPSCVSYRTSGKNVNMTADRPHFFTYTMNVHAAVRRQRIHFTVT